MCWKFYVSYFKFISLFIFNLSEIQWNKSLWLIFFHLIKLLTIDCNNFLETHRRHSWRHFGANTLEPCRQSWLHWWFPNLIILTAPVTKLITLTCGCGICIWLIILAFWINEDTTQLQNLFISSQNISRDDLLSWWISHLITLI